MDVLTSETCWALNNEIKKSKWHHVIFFSPSVYFQPLKCKAKEGTDDITINLRRLWWIYHADQMGREKVNITFWEETWKSTACRTSKKWMDNIKMHLWSRLWLWKLGWSDSESCSVVSFGVRGRALEVILAELKVQLKMNMYCVNRPVLSHISGEMLKNYGASCVGVRPVSLSLSRTLFPSWAVFNWSPISCLSR